MNETLLCLLVVVFAAMCIPMMLPGFVLMAQRKGFTDNPNARKLQQRPVSVLGGIVIASVISITLACAHLFVNLDALFLAMTMLVTLMMIGMIDDAIDVHFLIKLFIQIFVVALLFFSGHYRILTFGGLFGVTALNTTVSCLVSIFVGVFIINAINFIDGIDGLASLVGVFIGIVVGTWSLHHGCIPHAVLSFAYVGALLGFFFFNAFSKKYKMYMGDSGSLILGLYVYLSVCEVLSPASYVNDITKHYHISFAFSWMALPAFDMVRVCLFRIMRGKSPFYPDRSHLHHQLVDWGLPDVTVCFILLFLNLLVVGLWFVTASLGMGAFWQAMIVVAAAIVFIWVPAFQISYLQSYQKERYERINMRFLRLNVRFQQVHNDLTRLIDTTPVLFKTLTRLKKQ